MSNRSPEAQDAQRRKNRINAALWSTFAVVVVIVFIVLAKLVSGGGDTAGDSGSSPAPAALLGKLSSLKDSLFTAVGQGSVTKLPAPIDAPALTQDNKPRVLYVGAEYCPYCATERWPMVVALMRFGTFSNLKLTQSSSTDAYPSTQTFSFHGATYASQYLSFTGVETVSNTIQGNSYAPLDTLSAADEALENKYDAAPYVPAASAGSIPFIDFGGRYLISGSTYDPGTLQGKSRDQIADALSDPKNTLSQGAIGAANIITAALCNLTNNQPANVCSTSMIKDLQTKIDAQPKNGSN